MLGWGAEMWLDPPLRGGGAGACFGAMFVVFGKGALGCLSSGWVGNSAYIGDPASSESASPFRRWLWRRAIGGSGTVLGLGVVAASS